MSNSHSTEHFFDGKLTFHQSRHGYRFSIDAFLLGAGVPGCGALDILDAGCGCGVVAILAAFHNLDASVLAVDIQPQLVQAASLSVLSSQLEAQITVREADLRTLHLASNVGLFDLILLNPPFFPTLIWARQPKL